MPVVFWLFAKGDQQVFLDGSPLTSGRPNIAYGEHVLALRLTNLPAAQETPRTGGSLFRRLWSGPADTRHEQGLLMFAAQCSPQPRQASDVLPDPSQLLISRDDGTWEVMTTPLEADLWLRADFDDSQWEALVRTSIVEPSEKEYAQKHRYERLRKLGAVALGIQGGAQSVHVRKKFTLTPDGIK
jgi:hypothetical protein